MLADPRPRAPLHDAVHDRETESRYATRDTTRIDDVRIEAVRPLITPALLHEALPVPDAALELVERSRREVAAILRGEDRRLLVVVGPCSIHDHDQAIEYAEKLRAAANDLADDLRVVMRCYFEKPRTTVGWKGYINDPHLDGTFAINEGLRRARRLLLDVLALGLPVATEFLDLLSPQFVSDLVTWGRLARVRLKVKPIGSSPTAFPAQSASRTAPTATCALRWMPSFRRAPRMPSLA